MALTNCSITLKKFIKTAGVAIGSDNAQLVISPNTGYVVSASDFTDNTGSVTGITSISLSDSGTAGEIGNTVLVDVDLDDTYIMPAANTTLTIDIDGSAQEVEYTIAGTYDTAVSNATPSSETATAYSATGNYNQQVTVFTKTFTASSGYYFANAPTYKLIAANPERYNITYTDTTDNDGNLTARAFTIKYTFSNESQSGDNIRFTASAIEIFVPEVEITRYLLSLATIPITGENREMAIYGYPGATFSLAVTNEDSTSIISYTNQTIPDSGKFVFVIEFPTVTDNDQYDFVLTGSGVSSNFGGTGQQPHTFSLLQLIDINIAIGLTHADSSITTSANKSKTVSPLSVLGDTIANFDNDFTISSSTYDKLIIDNSSVTLTEFTNTDDNLNGGTEISIESLTFTTIDDTNIKAALSANVPLSGNADVTSLLALANYISGNMAPTNIALSSTSIDENNSVNDVVGTLSTTDADSGDTHTYTLVTGIGSTDNASFNISGSSLRAGEVFDYETKSSYSIRIRTTDNHGSYYEKTFTITINDVVETTNSYQVQKYTSSGATTSYYYINTTQYCNSGSLSATACDYSTLTNKFIKIKEGNCNGTEHIVQIKGASSTSANAYHADQNHYSSYSDADTNTSPSSCGTP
jgi:hypothetical protein